MKQEHITDPENEVGEEDEDTMEGKYLSFPLHNVVYGVEIRCVTEVIRFQEITAVPHMPEFMKGVINLRGRVIPTMDVRNRFLIPDREYDDRTCIVVVDIDQIAVGLIVDTVTGVVSIEAKDVEPPPKTRQTGDMQFILGMGKHDGKIIVLLNVHKLLREDELMGLETTKDRIDHEQNRIEV